MKFKFKALAAAVALAAAGQALADINPGNVAGGSLANSELVFFAYGVNASGGAATYVKDLGVTFNNFLTSPSYAAVDLDTADSSWSSFLGTSVVGARNWGVFAVQRNAGGASAANTYKVLTTANLNNADVTGLVGTNLVGAHGSISNAISAINGTGTTYATNSSYFYGFGAGGNANLGDYLGKTAGLGNLFETTNVIGTTTSAQFYNLAKGTGVNAVSSINVADVDASKAWTFDAGNVLSYGPVAAIPEPETYSMLAAGLLMLGAVARRRRV